MSQNILFKVLKTFDKVELERFDDYLNSPYFNKRKKLLECFRLIKSAYPNFDKALIDKGGFAKKLFPKKPFNEATLRNIISDLHLESLNFLTYEIIHTSKSDKYRYLLNHSNIKNLDSEWKKAIERFERDTKGKIDYNFFLNKHYIEAGKFNSSYLNSKINRLNKLDKEIKFLNQSTIDLIYYFIMELVNNFITIIIYSRNYNFDLHSNLHFIFLNKFKIKDLAAFIPKEDKHRFILNIYLDLINMFTNLDNERYYYKYKKSIESYKLSMSQNEVNFHFMNRFTYCIAKINEGRSLKYFNKEFLHICNNVVENKHYIEGNVIHLPHEMYRTILLFGLHIKQYDWAEYFVRKHSKDVHPKDIQNMYNFGMAFLNFETQKYDESLKFLNLIDTNYFIYKFDVKNIFLKIYYELGYTEQALSLIKTYSEFLRNNDIVNRQKRTRYKNFVKFLEKLILIKSGDFRQDKDYVKYQITQLNDIAFKDWLIEKLNKV